MEIHFPIADETDFRWQGKWEGTTPRQVQGRLYSRAKYAEGMSRLHPRGATPELAVSFTGSLSNDNLRS